MRVVPFAIGLIALTIASPAFAQVKTDCGVNLNKSAAPYTSTPGTQDTLGNDCVSAVIAGSIAGTDFSANQETVTFGAGPTFTPSIVGYVLIATIPANQGRRNCALQDRSTDTELVVVDNGAGLSATVFAMAPAATTGGQGGGFGCDEMKGRISVFAPSALDKAAVKEH